MFSIFVDICKEVIDNLKENDLETKKDRLRVAEILNDISNVLNDTAEKLKNDIYPHANCSIMEHLVNEIKPKLKDYLSEDKINKLEESIVEVIFIEKQFQKRKEPDTISNIEESAGQFKAMSILLKF